MSEYRELLAGCGHARDKRIASDALGIARSWRNLVTVDYYPACEPDYLMDLNHAPWYTTQNLTLLPDFMEKTPNSSMYVLGHYRFKESSFDEIHAYEVLEHLGSQGDAAMFFAQFTEIWRVLKPGGYLCATVPSRFSGWLWGDPSHRRAIVPESLVFLDQNQYIQQLDIAKVTAMSDFRHSHGYAADFTVVDQHDNREQFSFILKAVKPSRRIKVTV